MLVEHGVVQDRAERQVAAAHERHAIVAVGRDLRGTPCGVDVAGFAGQREDELERRIAERVGEHHSGLVGRRATGAQVGEVALDAPQALVSRPVEAPVDGRLHAHAQAAEDERDAQRGRRRRQR